MKKRIAFSAVAVILMAGALVFPRLYVQSSSATESAKPRAALSLMPDFIVDQAALRQHWVVRVEDLPATFCSVEEGGITPGEHTLLRFTVALPNIGTADL